MAINKKLIHFKTKNSFNRETSQGNILDNSIVFIQDSKEISTHGTLYKTVNWSVLDTITGSFYDGSTYKYNPITKTIVLNTSGNIESIPDQNLINNIKHIVITEGALGIGYYALSELTQLESITLPESLTYIAQGNFFSPRKLNIFIKNLEFWWNLLIEYGIDRDYDLYINGELVTELTIPNSMTKIKDYAFKHCISLTTITLPEGVTSIGMDAFVWCSSLTSITCRAVTPPTIDSYAFEGVDKSIPVYVPAGSVDTYKSAGIWRQFTNIQPISE